MKKLLLGAVCSLFVMAAHAQFLPPSFPEYVFPLSGTVPPPIQKSDNTSCYSYNIGWSGGGSGLGLVSSWDGTTGAGVAWMLDIGGPYVDQGYFTYPPGIRSVNVGIILAGPTGVQVNVTFHRAGSGHYRQIYNWNKPAIFGGPGTGLTLVSTTQLSNITTFTRISMDSHRGYGTGIIWENPNVGMYIVAANGNNYGPIFNMNGTRYHTDGDVAFTHAGPLDLHIAAYDRRRFAIYEYYVNWNDIIPGGPLAGACPPGPPFSACALPMIIEDANPVAQSQHYDIHIDAPDHYSVPNWSYVYTNYKEIYNRVMNHNPGGPISSGGVPGTICLTNGSYPLPPGLPAINNNGNYRPVVAYDQYANTNGYYVGWATGHTDPSYNPSSKAYVAAQFAEDGTLLNPAAPLMGVINNPSMISDYHSIAFSKYNDQNTGLYTVYTTNDGVDNVLTHKMTPWSLGTFRPDPTSIPEAEHNHLDAVTLSPNPFSSSFVVNVPASFGDQQIQLRITDMFGKVVAQQEGSAGSINNYLKSATSSLSVGSYVVSVLMPKLGYSEKFKAVKSE